MSAAEDMAKNLEETGDHAVNVGRVTPHAFDHLCKTVAQLIRHEEENQKLQLETLKLIRKAMGL